jgi:hypothetical protein
MSRRLGWALVVACFALGAAACGDGSEADKDSDGAVQASHEGGVETGEPARDDAGDEPRDAAAAAMDADTARRDAGTDAGDAGSAPRDAAMPARDANTPDASDASSAQSDAGATKITGARLFFFGHSLVDQDMPKMLGSLAAARSKSYTAAAQLGWGTQLRDHVDWDGNFDDAPLGFAEENQGREIFVGEGKAQLRTGRYDVMVLTESNGHTNGDGTETVEYATRLIQIARMAAPTIRVYLYANWLDRSEFANDDAWRSRTEMDITWWEDVASRINARIDGPDIFVIPGGVILARVTREAAQGRLSGLTVNDLFREGDGVHVNDRGFYVIALAHYAAIFRDSPLGLPAQTMVENGQAQAHTAENAMRLQQLVWDYLKAYPRAGITP